MNANELADALDWVCENHLTGIGDADFKATATMLRQQQAEIEALKQIIDANNLNQNIGQFVKPTNEPVAWTDGKGNYFDERSFFPVNDLIPLYTHPVKELPNNHQYIAQLEMTVRNQQAEIEALKQIIDANNLNQNIGQFVKPTNEPVAWMEIEEGGITEYKVWREPVSSKSIPLYTHPVKEQDTDCQYCKQGCIRCDARKQLTDEEIEDECRKAWGLHDQDQLNLEEVFKFARAILRKAQEK